MYEELHDKHPLEIRVLNDLAWILQEHYQEYEGALELAEEGLGLAPDDVHLLDTRGVILLQIDGRLSEAKVDFESLVQRSPSNSARQAKALLQLGRICSKLNEPDEAKQHLEKALEIDRKTEVFTVEERSEIASLMPQSGN